MAVPQLPHFTGGISRVVQILGASHKRDHVCCGDGLDSFRLYSKIRIPMTNNGMYFYHQAPLILPNSREASSSNNRNITCTGLLYVWNRFSIAVLVATLAWRAMSRDLRKEGLGWEDC